MRLLRCPECAYPVWLEQLVCERCGTEVMLDPESLTMVRLRRDSAESLRPCANRSHLCNWTVPAAGGHDLCFSCRLTRRSPEPDDAAAQGKLVVTAQAKRRLLVGLADLHLPVVPYWVREGGLAFDLLSSLSEGNDKVVIGHASGVITIDLAESLDDRREQLRVQLGEPYRTMLGHFRHEVGHYYQWQLVETVGGLLLDECRELFGDETASYQDAIKRHYAEGAPAGWEESYISEYATMHPWEDFAETFAHYQHIMDTLTTVANGGLQIIPDADSPILEKIVRPRNSYVGRSMEETLDDWRWVSHLLNRANHAMGKGDMYPFRIPDPVARKLAFVHHVVQESRVERSFQDA